MLENKKIIVTGGNGFLGKHIVNTLIKEEGVPEKNIFIPRSKNYDLRKEEHVKKMFRDFPANFVIHLATISKGIEYNKEHPGTNYYNQTIINSLSMHQAMMNKIEKFVSVGTALAYPEVADVPLKETQFWDGYPEKTLASIGLASKMMVAQSEAYRKEFGFNSIHVIPSNLYGPGDHFESDKGHVIPMLIKKFDRAEFNTKNVEIWGSGRASREFLYVEDAARGIISALKSYDKSEPLNIGSGEEITIKELVEKISKFFDPQIKLSWNATKPEGSLRRCLDSSKGSKELNFKPKTKFDEGLEKTINWFKENRTNLDD